MKVTTHIRAGAQAQKQNSKSINNTVVYYVVAAISRCVGI
jgi:hypothetical protein